jgi:8-hydroxy-5-deazaflavin:NADPH oxidoreductase
MKTRTHLLQRIVTLLQVAAVVGALFLPSSGLQAQARQASDLRIGIIGSGAMGGALGLQWAEAGHQVLFSSRNPDELMDLVRAAAPRASAGFSDAAAYFGDIVVLAVPPGAVPQLGEDFGHLMEGKIVIDITNPRIDRDGPITEEWLAMGTGLAMAQYLPPGVRLVKAFNTLAAGMIGEDRPADQRIGVPLAGDDEAAVAIVADLVRDAGFEPVMVGALERAREFDRGTDVWVTGMTAAEVRDALGLD